MTNHACNINQAQVELRKKVLVIAIVLYLISIVVIFLFSNALASYFFFFITLAFAFINYYQVTQRFCIAFAIQSIESQGAKLEAKKLTDSAIKINHLLYAFRILLQSFAYSAAVTLIVIIIFYLS